MTHHEAEEFAAAWIAAWNSHSLDRILSHYTEDFEMSSPFIVQFLQEPSGCLVGKKAIRAYWELALTRMPDLHFELISLSIGVHSLALHYTNHQERLGTEVFWFNDNKLVYRAAAHYLMT
jgi:ketosteroid isomerase-like protein